MASTEVSSETLPRLLDTRAIARELSLGRTTVLQLIASGELTSVRVGRRRLAKREDLAAFVDGLRPENGPDK